MASSFRDTLTQNRDPKIEAEKARQQGILAHEVRQRKKSANHTVKESMIETYHRARLEKEQQEAFAVLGNHLARIEAWAVKKVVSLR